MRSARKNDIHPIICKQCGVPAYADRPSQQFCGIKCASNGRSYQEWPCIDCGELFQPTHNKNVICKDCKELRKQKPETAECVKCQAVIKGGCRTCKSCQQAMKRQHTKKANAEAARKNLTKIRTCKDCGDSFTNQEHKTVGRSNGHGRCVPCAVERKRKVARQQSRKSDRRRRARKKLATDGITDRMIFDRDGWRCVYCKVLVRVCDGINFADPNMATIDHVIPLSKGGTDLAENKVCACRKCNCHDKGTANWLLF